MPTVKNLRIVKMNGVDNTYFATWQFDGKDIPVNADGSSSGGSSNIAKGDWVKVKEGSKWYNGATIPSYVFNDTWQVIEVSGDRAVINKNKSGSQSIMSPINVNNLTKADSKARMLRASSDISPYAMQSDFSINELVKLKSGAIYNDNGNPIGSPFIDQVWSIVRLSNGIATLKNQDQRSGGSVTAKVSIQYLEKLQVESFSVGASVRINKPESGTTAVVWSDGSVILNSYLNYYWVVTSVNGYDIGIRSADGSPSSVSGTIKSWRIYNISGSTSPVGGFSVGDSVRLLSGSVMWDDEYDDEGDVLGSEYFDGYGSYIDYTWTIQSFGGTKFATVTHGSISKYVYISDMVKTRPSTSVSTGSLVTIRSGSKWSNGYSVTGDSLYMTYRVNGFVGKYEAYLEGLDISENGIPVVGTIDQYYLDVVTIPNLRVGDNVTINAGAVWSNGVIVSTSDRKNVWFIQEIHGQYAKIANTVNTSQTGEIGLWRLTYTDEDPGESYRIDTLSHYELMWAYYTNQGMWFHDGDATTYAIAGAYDGSATYSPPEQAVKFRVQVRPVAKTHKVNDQDVAYWTGTWALLEYTNSSYYTPEVPDVPTVELDELDMTVSLDNITDSKAELIKFEIYDGTKLYNTSGNIKVSAAMAQYQTTVNPGGNYRARAKAGAWNESGVLILWSDWSGFSDGAETIPSAPSGITTIRAASSTSVFLQWPEVTTADTYDIEYATNPVYLEGSNATTTISSITTTQYTITGLESGDEYYFRVRAVNDQGHSDWTDIRSVIIGATPAAPTTWSSATTVIVGDPLNLYWVHNAKDNSWETYAQLEMYIDDVKQDVITIASEQVDDPDDDTDVEKTHSYAFDTSVHAEGTTLKWRVRTAGITENFGDWSIQRQVDIYARPTLSLSVTDYNGQVFETLTRFPFHINAFAGPKTQEPIGYHVLITALTSYETVDAIGNPLIIKAGTEMYSQYFDINTELDIDISASDIDLEVGQMYHISVVVSMNSGLTAEATRDFNVMWSEEEYEPDTEITVDMNSYTAYLIPYCRDYDGYPVEDVELSVYRREYNGGYKKIASGIDPKANTMVTDPHPSLDYARYRIIATSTITGAVSYYDPPGYPISGPSIETPVVIQWDEEWQNFNTTNPDEATDPLWSGSMIQIPWNIKVQENSSADVTLVNYIGREYPVSYYGTSIDTTASWSFEFPKEDADTIYAFRRLQVWKGDVYIREPSGSGYWANVKVGMDLDYDNLVVPVTLDITRVEGGI